MDSLSLKILDKLNTFMQRDRMAASIHLEGISNRNMKERLTLGSLWFGWLAERGAEAASDGWSVASALQAQGWKLSAQHRVSLEAQSAGIS